MTSPIESLMSAGLKVITAPISLIDSLLGGSGSSGTGPVVPSNGAGNIGAFGGQSGGGTSSTLKAASQTVAASTHVSTYAGGYAGGWRSQGSAGSRFAAGPSRPFTPPGGAGRGTQDATGGGGVESDPTGGGGATSTSRGGGRGARRAV